MRAAGGVADLKIDSYTRTASDQCVRGHTPRSPEPARTRLEARSPASRPATVVDLVRGSHAQGFVGPMSVVPGEPNREFILKSGTAEGNHDEPSRALGLECPDQPLDDRDGAILAD